MVSVVIPNYNHSQYLVKRIDSVLAQSYQSFELILLDDCSTDNSREVIEKYRSHEKVSHIVYNEQNSGSTFKQWQKGLTLAKGNFVWIAESDDWAETDFLSEVMFLFEKDVSLSYISTDSFIVDAVGHKIARGYSHDCFTNKSLVGYRVHKGADFVANHLFVNCVISNASAVVFKKDLASDLLQASQQFKLAGDWLFWVKMAQKGNVGIIHKCLNNFRVHQGTVRNTMKAQLQVQEYYKVLKYIKENFKLTNQQKSKAFSFNSIDAFRLKREGKLTFSFLLKSYFETVYKVDFGFLFRIFKLYFLDKLYFSVFFLKGIKNKILKCVYNINC